MRPPWFVLLPREEVSKARLDKIRGVERHDRLDAELFNDFESEDQGKVLALFTFMCFLA